MFAYSQAVADASSCIHIPKDAPVDLAEGAALLVNYGTAHLALSTRCRMAEGETVLVTAAAGGVGLASVELALRMGAGRVIAACGSEEKLDVAVEKGAGREGVNYGGMGGAEFRARLREVAGKSGIDCMLDMVGGEMQIDIP